ncbi:hypothetical protein ATO3_14465 [Marinibacterium profundimaris]|uniref:Uncharacterized protein n=1 Tax=Marinibacterium profundimaris TaxID=1679460 RepID=A0A225NHG1_9RHOB|nr:hypothetical protein ATO3_14465 [Marinibacterium profundimaris]
MVEARVAAGSLWAATVVLGSTVAIEVAGWVAGVVEMHRPEPMCGAAAAIPGGRMSGAWGERWNEPVQN